MAVTILLWKGSLVLVVGVPGCPKLSTDCDEDDVYIAIA
jgi:hypothetical protein